MFVFQKALLEAGELKWGTDEAEFVYILGNRSKQHLRLGELELAFKEIIWFSNCKVGFLSPKLDMSFLSKEVVIRFDVQGEFWACHLVAELVNYGSLIGRRRMGYVVGLLRREIQYFPTNDLGVNFRRKPRQPRQKWNACFCIQLLSLNSNTASFLFFSFFKRISCFPSL